MVGGGISGVSVCLALARRGVTATLVERAELGAGASTRNAGFLMRGAADNYARAVESYGRETARALWRLTEENLRGLVAEGAAALPSFSQTPSCLLALEEEEHEALHRSFDLLREDGFAARMIDDHDDAAWSGPMRPLGGLVNPQDAMVNPAELLGLLGSKLPSAPIEHQEVHAIEPGPEGVAVRLTDGVVLADRVVVCTNASAAELLPQLGGVVEPNRGQMLAVRAAGRRLAFAYYANHGHEYFRQASPETIVVGGCRDRHADAERTLADRTTEATQGAIERFAASILGDPIEVTARWAGIMGFSADGLPVVGPVDGADPEESRVWCCVGFTGHGMSLAYAAAYLAAGGLLGDAGAPADHPFDSRRFRRAPAS